MSAQQTVPTDNISRSHEPTHRLVRRPVGAPAERQSIFDEAPAADPSGHATPANRKLSIDERFALFNAEHPEVYVALVRLARQGKAAGATKLGIKQLVEIVRWGRLVETGDDGFRVNNVLSSRFSRAIMEREPDLAGMFDVRELKSS